MYLIPRNIKQRMELFYGIGVFEVLFILASLGFAFLLNQVLVIFFNEHMLFLTYLFTGVLAYMLCKPDVLGDYSPVKMLKDIILFRFFQRTNQYPYIFGTGRKTDV